MTEQEEQALEVLNELAQAWRGDWTDFDGRTLRDQIGLWSENVMRPALRGENIDEAAALFRSQCGLCPRGRGQWVDWCDEDCLA